MLQQDRASGCTMEERLVAIRSSCREEEGSRGGMLLSVVVGQGCGYLLQQQVRAVTGVVGIFCGELLEQAELSLAGSRRRADNHSTSIPSSPWPHLPSPVLSASLRVTLGLTEDKSKIDFYFFFVSSSSLSPSLTRNLFFTSCVMISIV